MNRPASTRHWYNVDVILGQRLRCWPNIATTLDQNLVSWKSVYVFQVRGDGVASDIEFNNQGSPKHVSYDYVNMKSGGWLKVTRTGTRLKNIRIILTLSHFY